MTIRSKKKIAIVYDRVNKWGGAERVLLALHEMYPTAPLYTSVYDKDKAPWAKVFPNVITSFIQKIPFAKSNHEFLAPLMPFAFESFDFSDYDVIISVTSEAAKGVITTGKTTHICYCLTPTRYLWSGYNDYFKNPIFKAVTKPIVNYLQKWDIKASKRPDVMISISSTVQNRIKKYYHRYSEITYPPVKIPGVSIQTHTRCVQNYYLIVSRLDYGYKKVNLAISAFNNIGYPLFVVGSGRLSEKLKSLSKQNIKFVGKVSESELVKYYRGAKALIMPQEEDFGIVAVEAQSYGVPVIAYKNGGALDTVIDGKTGVLFKNQTVKSLTEAVLRFEKIRFKADNLVNNAKKFSKEKFKIEFAKIVHNATKRQ